MSDLGFDFLSLPEPKQQADSDATSSWAEAIEHRNIDVLKDLFNQSDASDVKKIKHDGKLLWKIGIEHFNADIMDVLLAHDVIPVKSETLFKAAWIANNINAIEWVKQWCTNTKTPTPNAEFWEKCLDSCYSKDSSLVSFAFHQHPTLSIGNYAATSVLSKLIEAKDISSVEKMMTCEIHDYTNTVISSSDFLKYFISSHARQFQLRDCQNLQYILEHSKPLQQVWKSVFPVDLYGTKYDGFLDLMLNNNNFLIWSSIAQTTQGQSIIEKRFKNEQYIRNFVHNSSTQAKKELIKAMPDFFQNWRDRKGCNIAHIILSNNVKSDVLMLYSSVKELLSVPNDANQTPLDLLEGDIKKTIENKLLRKELNNEGLGLLHNRTKKQKRKM